MIRQGFPIGQDDWYCEVLYDVRQNDLREVYYTLLDSGCPDYMAQKACMVLSSKNKGYTFTNLHTRHSVMFISATTSAEQMYDSIQHETKHTVEHISDFFDVDPKSEESAYLQGEIARLMFPAAAIVICPVCRHKG
ncbi:MAG: hypothetical protein IJ588_12470 [Prevotella sp.]|nr:hypothetical protein [Prevotella sp.]